ncbi:unnamed protein product [Sphagnum jensenii]|uniref:Uncharacterized protein n=1 Tax=Sphagnum jensenii TaxID=128206 RepID=A0ABP0X7C7_9BRYO
MGLTEEHVRLTTGAATAAVIRHGQVLVPKEGNEGKRENHSDDSASTTPHNAQQHRKRERQKNSQPSRFLLTEVIHHPHSSSVPSSRNTSSLLRVHPSFPLFIHTFSQKNIRSPQNSSILSRRRRSVASEFILHPHSSSILYSK